MLALDPDRQLAPKNPRVEKLSIAHSPEHFFLHYIDYNPNPVLFMGLRLCLGLVNTILSVLTPGKLSLDYNELRMLPRPG